MISFSEDIQRYTFLFSNYFFPITEYQIINTWIFGNLQILKKMKYKMSLYKCSRHFLFGNYSYNGNFLQIVPLSLSWDQEEMFLTEVILTSWTVHEWNFQTMETDNGKICRLCKYFYYKIKMNVFDRNDFITITLNLSYTWSLKF